MDKMRLVFGLAGVAIGIVIGFLFANGLNRAGDTRSAASPPVAGMPGAPASGMSPGQMSQMPAGAPAGGGSVPQVMAAIERARSEPQNLDAQLEAGDMYYRIQRFDEAGKFYEAALKIDPKNAPARTKFANSLFDAGKYAEAQAAYRAVLEVQPKDAAVLTDLGLTYYLQEPPDLPNAIKHFKSALEIKPDMEPTLQNLAVAYRDANDDANYKSTIEKLKKVNPQNRIANGGL